LAFAQPLLINSPAKLGAVWFSEKERIIVTTIGTYFNVLGVSVAYFIPSLYVNESVITESDKK
jgi:hypothetical protein